MPWSGAPIAAELADWPTCRSCGKPLAKRLGVKAEGGICSRCHSATVPQHSPGTRRFARALAKEQRRAKVTGRPVNGNKLARIARQSGHMKVAA